ncbi:MAG TPA: ribosome biogenesis factor YjgA [Steroidobacteraceae bacterium]|nr:ribosome biogenesis factor YjgA [Steroidobacteraceae bacterium]
MIRRRHDDLETDQERPSKSARKRAAEDLQQLGEELISMSEAVLEELPLPENLRDAVLAARRFPSHGAQLRQRQYIGKLMRKIDAEAIRAAVRTRQQQQDAAARQFKRIEQWRERLLREPEAALGDLLAEHPQADVARLRLLISNAGAEARGGSAPRAARELFHHLRDLLAAVSA